MTSEFFKAWGAVPEEEKNPNDIRGIIADLKVWLASPPREAESLRGRIIGTARQLRDAAGATFAELEANPQQAEPLRSHNLTMAQGFEAIGKDLDLIYDALGELQAGQVAEVLSWLEKAVERVASAKAAVEEWMESPLPLCPCCGSRGDGSYCAGCNLDVLIPDLDEVDRTSFRRADLGRDYQLVYDAYMAVVGGRSSLSLLFQTLQRLESRLNEWGNLTAALDDPELAEPLAEIEDCLEGALDGLELMREVSRSRRVRDLNEGWKQIFEHAVALQAVLPQLARSAGQEVPQDSGGFAAVGEDSVVLGQVY